MSIFAMPPARHAFPPECRRSLPRQFPSLRGHVPSNDFFQILLLPSPLPHLSFGFDVAYAHVPRPPFPASTSYFFVR